MEKTVFITPDCKGYIFIPKNKKVFLEGLDTNYLLILSSI